MEYDVVLLPTFAQARQWSMRHAEQGAGLFSQTVATFDAWIGDLWELHGDGRVMVEPLQRLMVMRQAFREVFDEETLPGIVSLAAKCVSSASGVPAFESAVEAAGAGANEASLADQEVDLLKGIARYYEILADLGCVELGSAASMMAEAAQSIFHGPMRVLRAGGQPKSWIESSFFTRCAACGVEVVEAEDGRNAGSAGGGQPACMRFAFPSGRYAQPALVADLVEQAGTRTGGFAAIVSCKDPLAMFRQIEGRLADEGLQGCVKARVPFGQTDFGRAFVALHRIVTQDTWSKADLSDVVSSPFSGFTRKRALEIDRCLRADRLADRDACLAALRIESDTFSQLEEAVSDPEADILLGVFEQAASNAPGRSAAWRSEQLSAISALRSCTSIARKIGADMESCVSVLGNAGIQVSYQGGSNRAGDGLQVLVTSKERAAQMGTGACNVLVMCDLTSADYPIADKDDAAATLFSRLGLRPVDAALADARRELDLLRAVPANELVCVRPLNDWDGNETYPSAMLQELIDAYRQDIAADDDLDEVLGVPERFSDTAIQRGEELLYQNAKAGAASLRQPADAIVSAPLPGYVSPPARRLVALPRRVGDGKVLPGISPSPSQVELYLSCPHKWFVQHRLNVGELDEQFGALERGSYAHAVLQEFYQRFQEAGHAKVNAANLQDARSLMRGIADEFEAAQLQMPPGSGRYVAADQFEQRELRAVKAQLVSYLDFEAALLPGYHPAYFEHAIRAEDGVQYAGTVLVGTVDRIDVDDNGNAVVIDYKGSLNSSHEIAGKSMADPGKVQARMYAQAVKRQLGFNVVGAFYVSYGKTHGVAGACDALAIDAAHLPGARLERCRCAVATPSGEQDEALDFASMRFDDMLDATESLVAQVVQGMREGSVQPKPATPDSCTYCPVLDCPGRGR